ncbi:MAG: NlpC/P60 family protein [Crinalium sp.]
MNHNSFFIPEINNDKFYTTRTKTADSQIIKHFFSQEFCGLIVNNNLLIPAKNIADNPNERFVLDPQAWIDAEAKGQVTCIVHSHTNGNNNFSPADITACKQLNIPFYLLTLPIGDEAYYDPRIIQPYIGRQWQYGATDCYALVRDWYKQELDVKLADFERGEIGEWEDLSWNKFAENFGNQGFIKVSEQPQKNDVILMQISAPHPNHVGVIIEESGYMLHHLCGRLSEKALFGGYWKKTCISILRKI